MASSRIKNWTIAVLTAILFGSVALNAVLFTRGRADYLSLNQTRLDPLGLVGYTIDPAELAESDPNETTVVFYGDSRARDWTPPNAGPGFRFVNRGIGAQTSEQVLARFDDQIAPLLPDVVIVQVGINDLKTIPLFPDQEYAIIERCKENIETIVKESRELGATVILTTIFPVGEVPLERRPFWSPEVAPAVDTVNEFIKLQQGEGVAILDSAVLEDDNGKIRREYSRDMLHLNPAGYVVLNDQLKTVLASLTR